MKRIISSLTILFLALIVLSSCSHSLGYSVLLWDIPEVNLQDGAILKVNYKSNISHVYLVSHPVTKESLEIPLWKLSDPSSKKKAETLAKVYEEYKHTYASIKLDGLPVREEAVNTAKQVYRLYKGEIVKILRKGKGQDVMTGKGKKLEGDWLLVMTDGGTRGWCFSYNLSIFETGENGTVVSGVVEEVQDDSALLEEATLEAVLKARWYPEVYLSLIRNKTIDLDRMQNEFGFDPGASSGQISINVKDNYRTAVYKGVTKTESSKYEFTGTPFKMTIVSEDRIIVEYTDVDDNVETYAFVTQPKDKDFAKSIEGEKRRRSDALFALYNIDVFKSSNYGKLVFNSENTFTWSGYGLLEPEIIAKSARGRGRVAIKYLLSSKFTQVYDGILTFNFENMSDEVNFFYKLEPTGLTFVDASECTIRENVVTNAGNSSISIFFER